jgi:hypothetical protein
MTFSDVLEYVKAGGQGALPFLVWVVFLAFKRISAALDTLTEIRDQLAAGRLADDKANTRLAQRIEDVHTLVIELPLNIYRSNRR